MNPDYKEKLRKKSINPKDQENNGRTKVSAVGGELQQKVPAESSNVRSQGSNGGEKNGEMNEKMPSSEPIKNPEHLSYDEIAHETNSASEKTSVSSQTYFSEDQLKTAIEHLFRKMAILEELHLSQSNHLRLIEPSVIEAVNELIDRRLGVKVNCATQTDLSFDENPITELPCVKLKNTPVVYPPSRTQTDDITEPASHNVSVSVNKESGVKCTTGQKEDDKKGMNSSSKVKLGEKEKPQNDPTNIDYPTVLFLTDSIMKGVESKRLGKAYDFQNHMTRCYTSEEIIPTLQKETDKLKVKVDAVVIHVGINDLKKKSPNEASSDFVRNIKQVKEKLPNTRLMISKVAPVRDEEKNANRELFNALTKSSLRGAPDILFVDHENVNPYDCQHLANDGIHPNDAGTRVLAANMGRHIRDMMWKKKKGRRNNTSQHERGQEKISPRRSNADYWEPDRQHRHLLHPDRRSRSPYSPHHRNKFKRPDRYTYRDERYMNNRYHNRFSILQDYYD